MSDFVIKSGVKKHGASLVGTDWIANVLREIRETGIRYWAERVVAAYDQQYGPVMLQQGWGLLRQATDVALYGEGAMEHWDARACIEAARKYNRDQKPAQEPFMPTQWSDFNAARASLRDRTIPCLGRESLMAIGETIEQRQRSMTGGRDATHP